MKGAAQDENKLKGGILGLGRGLLGAVAKPVAGSIELIQKTGEGLSATIRGTESDAVRKQHPRYFSNCLVLVLVLMCKANTRSLTTKTTKQLKDEPFSTI